MKRPLLLLLLPACFDTTVPKDAIIACGSDEECPSTLLCNQGFCGGDGDDRVPPGVIAESVLVQPPRVAPLSTLTVSFEPTEELQGLPVVTAGDLPLQGAASGAFFAYAVDLPADLDSAPLAVVAELEDLAGNASTVNLGVVVVDATPPARVSADCPDVLRAGSSASITVEADENLSSTSTCALRDPLGATTVIDAEVQGRRLICSTDDAPAGTAMLLDLTLVDVAGNSARDAGVCNMASF